MARCNFFAVRLERRKGGGSAIVAADELENAAHGMHWEEIRQRAREGAHDETLAELIEEHGYEFID